MRNTVHPRKQAEPQPTLLDVSTALNVTGNASDNRLNGNGFNNTLSGMAGNDSLFGMGGNDKLNGGNGNDTLDGGSGSDLLDGGLGNDVYYVDEAGDVVNEAADAGADLVWSAISDTLDANVENMTLLEVATALKTTGNASNNVLTGNSFSNELDGSVGNDTLIGGQGNDVYFIDSVGDVVSKTNLAGSGADLVVSSISDTLDANVENMTLGEVATALNATGNASNNLLTGNSFGNTLSGMTGNDTLFGRGGNDNLNGGDGNDTLDGGTGADLMAGGNGNDFYLVDDAGDLVSESSSAGGGIDTVNSRISDTLDANVENMTLLGVATASAATGNALTAGLHLAGTSKVVEISAPFPARSITAAASTSAPTPARFATTRRPMSMATRF